MRAALKMEAIWNLLADLPIKIHNKKAVIAVSRPLLGSLQLSYATLNTFCMHGKGNKAKLLRQLLELKQEHKNNRKLYHICNEYLFKDVYIERNLLENQ